MFEKKNASIRSVYNLITSQSEPFCVVNIPRFLLLKITVVFLIVDKNVYDGCGLVMLTLLLP